MQVVNVNILQFIVATTITHGLNQTLRSAGNTAQVDMITRLDNFDRLSSRHVFDLFLHGGY